MSFGIIKWNQNMMKKAKLCYMDTDSFIVNEKKTDDICKDIAGDVETRLQIMN